MLRKTGRNMALPKPSETAAEKPRVLIVEDDEGLIGQLKWALDDFEVFLAPDRPSALAVIESKGIDVVLLDLGLPPHETGVTEGLRALDEILSAAPGTKVIINTGQDDRNVAMQAIAGGAYDFCSKSADSETLALIIGRAAHVQNLERENRTLLEQTAPSGFRGLITDNQEMLAACRVIEKVANTTVTVLLNGESGVGKELFARGLHQASDRAGKPFIAINCAAIPESLLESELFGHEKGAFTGATKQTVGKVEAADGGTLFLDEIGDLPASLQAKLLRFLQDRTIERVGGRKEIPVNLRIVCATHQDLEAMMADGRFRQDLFFRLDEVRVFIPPLRERKDDIPLLSRFFLNRFNKEFGKNLRGFTPEVERWMETCAWPGNVRELENRIKKAVIMAEDSVLHLGDLGVTGSSAPSNPAPNAVPEKMSDGGGDASAEMPTLKQSREVNDRTLVCRALEKAGGNITKASKLLGVSRPTLYDMMRQLGIEN